MSATGLNVNDVTLPMVGVSVGVPVLIPIVVVSVGVGVFGMVPWQACVPESVKVLPASGTNCQS